MFIKALVLVLIVFTANAVAHAIPGIQLDAKIIENSKILITASFEKSGQTLVGNKIKLISRIDNKILFEEKLAQKGLVTTIPKEPYWIYLIVRDNDVVIDGPAPKNGFEIVTNKKEKAFIYTTSISLLCIFLGILFLIKNKRAKKREESY